MRKNHILVKFFSQKEYASDFLHGKFYMNSLHYFWNEFHQQSNLSSAQADLLEGTVGTIQLNSDDKGFMDGMLTDALLRAVGYQYCNVLCFYKLNYITKHKRNKILIKFPIPKMSECGNYVVIIKNKMEFQRRIKKSFAGTGFKFICGDIEYRQLEKSGIPVDISGKHNIVLKADKSLDIPLENLEFGSDCFTKSDVYKNQSEWRLAVYRGIKNIGAYKHDIGDLSDIAVLTTADNLVSEIDRLLLCEEIKKSITKDYGNINRDEMKKMFYSLGDNKCEMIIFFG